MDNEMTRLSLKAGYCGDSALSPPYCVLEQSDCAPSEYGVYLSSREMQGSPYSAHGGSCAWGSTVKDIVEDMDFGACVDASGAVRCAWAEADCMDGESYAFPVEDCTCDKVRVGGCEHNGEAFCAVSEDACDEASIWFDPLGIARMTNTECYLCIAPSSLPVGTDPEIPSTSTEAPMEEEKDDEDLVPPSSTNAPVTPSLPTTTTDRADAAPLATLSRSNESNSASEGADTTMIAAVASILCAVVLLALAVTFRRAQAKKNIDVKERPSTTLEISDKEIGVDADIVSNLDEEEFVSKEEGNFS